MNGNIQGVMLGQPGQQPPTDDESMESSEVCVPLKALQQPDDNEEMQTPSEGDTVSLTVDAAVTRIEGNNAYVKPMSVNGVQLDNEGGESEDDSDQAEGDALRQEAMQQGQPSQDQP